ncbi:hypothetical protein GGF32_006596 [Allomyces javanicus]|nr:hypothetical protein GGF32_006596 [Allomyces javanicus]
MDEKAKETRIALSLIKAGIPLPHLFEAIRDNVHGDLGGAQLWLAKQQRKGDPRVFQRRIGSLKQKPDATKQLEEVLKQELDTMKQKNKALLLQIKQLVNPQPDVIGRVPFGRSRSTCPPSSITMDAAMAAEFAKIKGQMLYPHAKVPELTPFPHHGNKTAVQMLTRSVKNKLRTSNHERLLDLDPILWAALLPKLEISDELANVRDAKIRQSLLMAMGVSWRWYDSNEFPTTAALFGFIARAYTL